MIRDRQQGVGVGRQIDARDRWSLVGNQINESGILMGKAVVVLAPDSRRQQDVLGSDRGAPRHVVLADVQPLGVLVEHGIDDMGKGFIGVEKTMTAREQITLQPADEGMLGKHLHDAAIARELAAVGVFGKHVGHPGFFADFVNRLEPVGGGLVRAEDAEAGHVVLHHIAQELAQGFGVLVLRCASGGNLDGIFAKVGKLEFLAQQPAVGVRVGAHAPIALWAPAP